MFFRYLLKLPYHIRDIVHYFRAFSRDEHVDMRIISVKSDRYLEAAKKLHAEVYLHRGFVANEDIVDGIISFKADPHQLHSRYFVVADKKTGQIVATARQIEEKKGHGHNSFALVKQARLYPGAVREIRKHAPSACVEISGLAKRRRVSKLAPLLLYRALWHHSLRQKHTIWLLALDVRLFVRLKLLFGSAIQKAGKVTPYYGGDVVPAILKVQSSVAALNSSLRKARFMQRKLRSIVVRFMITGMPVSQLSAKERRAHDRLRIDLGVSGEARAEPIIKRPKNLRRKIRVVAIVASLAYTIVRFFFVKIALESYGVNPWLFLVLDAVAGVVYVLAIEHLVIGLIGRRGKTMLNTLAWVVVAFVTFAAPYAYIYMASSQLPAGVGIGIAILVGLLLMNAVAGVVRRVRSRSS